MSTLIRHFSRAPSPEIKVHAPKVLKSFIRFHPEPSLRGRRFGSRLALQTCWRSHMNESNPPGLHYHPSPPGCSRSVPVRFLVEISTTCLDERGRGRPATRHWCRIARCNYPAGCTRTRRTGSSRIWHQRAFPVGTPQRLQAVMSELDPSLGGPRKRLTASDTGSGLPDNLAVMVITPLGGFAL